MKAAGRGQLSRLQYLIRLGVDIDHSDDQGLTALHHAVLSGFEDCVKELVKVGTDLNAVTAFEETPLNLAAQKKREHIVRILLKARADTQQALDREGIQEAERIFLLSCMGILDSDSESERPASSRPIGETRSMHVRPNTTPLNLDRQSEQYDYPTPNSHEIHRGVASNVRKRRRTRQNPSTQSREDDYLDAGHTFQSGHNTYSGWEPFGGLSDSPFAGSRKERPTHSSGSRPEAPYHPMNPIYRMPTLPWLPHEYPVPIYSPYSGYPPTQVPPPLPPPIREPKEIVKEVGSKEVEKKDTAMIAEMNALRALIKQQDEERIARERAIEAAELAKKLAAEREAQRKQEIAAASAAAKQAAEKAAEDTAKIVKVESDKKLAESEAARMELEKRLERQQKEHIKREQAIRAEYETARREMEAGQGV